MDARTCGEGEIQSDGAWCLAKLGRDPKLVAQANTSGGAVAKVSVPVPTHLANELQESFWNGPIQDDQGRRLHNEEEVDRIGFRSPFAALSNVALPSDRLTVAGD